MLIFWGICIICVLMKIWCRSCLQSSVKKVASLWGMWLIYLICFSLKAHPGGIFISTCQYSSATKVWDIIRPHGLLNNVFFQKWGSIMTNLRQVNLDILPSAKIKRQKSTISDWSIQTPYWRSFISIGGCKNVFSLTRSPNRELVESKNNIYAVCKFSNL